MNTGRVVSTSKSEQGFIPISHCGASGILKGLFRNIYKFIIARPCDTFSANVLRKQAAFTLAEVLITLGIIGVIAAMPIPMLVAKYQKLVVETKLQVFYAQINDAFRRAHADYDGTFDDWVIKDKDYSYDENKMFLETYLLPYVKYTKVEKYTARTSGQTYACVFMVNGTICVFL